MKKLVLATAVLATFTATASAKDMYYHFAGRGAA
jgi:hypothetical protein